MSRVDIRPQTFDNYSWVAEHLREEDRNEIEAASGRPAHHVLIEGCARSEYVWCAYVDGVPSVLFGVAKGGIIWLVGTDKLRTAALPIFRMSKDILGSLLEVYPRLRNHADCRNTLHLRWLKLLGFTFDEVIEINGHRFQRFHIDREEPQCATP